MKGGTKLKSSGKAHAQRKPAQRFTQRPLMEIDEQRGSELVLHCGLPSRPLSDLRTHKADLAEVESRCIWRTMATR